VSAHLQQRIERCPTPIREIAWKAQVRPRKRYRRLVARGKNPYVVVTAIAQEILAFLRAIAREVRSAPERAPEDLEGEGRGVAAVWRNPRQREEGASADPRAWSEEGA